MWRLISFIQAARGELRKVVWPTRHESITMTLTVIIMVFVASLFLWGIDSMILRIIQWLVEQKG